MTTTAMEAVLSELNPQQREGAVHGRGPLLIVAGAGTGKTTTLAHRVAHLVATGVDPGKILLLTFTRRAAAEMLRRVAGIIREVTMASGGRQSPDASNDRSMTEGVRESASVRKDIKGMWS